ncbi:methylmalonyl Co-A mutase-associated GTPase MeaB [Allosaccharopolyspora coralli]|uniref:Methylmalonyl Co-A mutase-associated GTPase MeaB n=1 Tax=Allosaccharopolyspora coralli TaxID=2665642 RepID=A0A5Q3Q8D2_9PSEU|nr:methylmalonyl Co-A mutase-associated GTPase MeaB [Allosaccharopolyspora coralli]QGK70742.1 methylmalonyl Co-A mutase-associated GTPase MeaB [Allosaccharopolyspora coralli]
MPRTLSVDEYAKGVLDGSRTVLARAITLVESTHPDHRDKAQQLLVELLPHSGNAHRVGITGVPGVGKSTFIEGLGSMLTGRGHRVAVLAVDPSSSRTGGSILGDKTRMGALASDPAAFVRPSPTAGTLGGVARATRETMVLMEAAGHDVVLVETVGVGQSEITVADMVDCFLVLALARTGDQLQGIKKGVLEIADLVAVNKADGPHEGEARKAARELRSALRMLTPASVSWKPPVLTCSGLEGTGLADVWDQVEQHRATLTETSELADKRSRQQIDWTWALVREHLMADLTRNPRVTDILDEVQTQVRAGELTASLAADRLLRAFRGE